MDQNDAIGPLHQFSTYLRVFGGAADVVELEKVGNPRPGPHAAYESKLAPSRVSRPRIWRFWRKLIRYNTHVPLFALRAYGTDIEYSLDSSILCSSETRDDMHLAANCRRRPSCK